MSKLKLNITMSLDGYVAGPDQSMENPLGVGGEQLHDWIVPLTAWRESHGMEGGEANASTPFAAYGETTIVGTRKPSWPKSSAPAGSESVARGSGMRGGRTWSKNPPHSS